MADEVLLAFSTFPDTETARRLARQLVEEKLVACANLLPSIESIYRWQGKVEQATEVLTLFKLTAASYPAFEARLKALHPYDVPEIIATRVVAGLEAYHDWVTENSA